jgi:hypothetical protein
MAKTSFSIKNYSQEISIDKDSFKSNNNYNSHILTFDCVLNLRFDKHKGSDNNGFELINYNAKLIAGQNQVYCGETFGHLSIRVTGDQERRFYIEFFLSLETIHAIEKIRKSDIKFKLELSFQTAHYRLLMLTNNTYIDVVTSFSDDGCRLEAEIPQSKWVSELLPNLGYNETRLIEIANYNHLLGDAYESSVKEMEAANEYFIKGDYDKTVAHCRAAVEAVKKKLDVIKESLVSRSEKDWVKSVYESTYDWLEKMTKSTFVLSSKSHHYPSLGHFSRDQAEIIKVITLGIVAFAGRIQKEDKNDIQLPSE